MGGSNSSQDTKLFSMLFPRRGQPVKVMSAGMALMVLIAAQTAVLSVFSVALEATAQPLGTKALDTPGQTVAPAPAGALKDKERQDFPATPSVRSGPLSAAVTQAVAAVGSALRENRFPTAAVKTIGQGGDARMAWYLFDLMRFVGSRANAEDVMLAFERLTQAALPRDSFGVMGDRLLAWNLPAPPGYREMKRDLFLQIEPRWQPFFDDAQSVIDWRQVGWGGVFIDDRTDATQGQICPRGCIPALDQPKTTPAAQGTWYPDKAIVFGLVINGEARAYPKHMMEVHEMVNDTLGGRQIGMPYCTLCRSVQAYYTDRVVGFKPVLRTSGLLSRSNKFMYDVRSFSAIDTFTGQAISGPLHRASVVLPQATVVISTWAAWRKAYPNTTILAEDGGVGRRYPLNPLRGRDDQGPIFPVGPVDPRLGVHDVVLGVTAPNGQPLAFPRAAVQLALKSGESVRLGGVTVRSDADGFRAFVGDTETPAQEAFWFAWSQFRPGTLLWQRER
jgi:hypothetical protein